MLTQTIRKLSDFRVILTYPEIPTFKLVMDFGPLVEHLGPTGPYCLLHWQAAPKGERRWGVFDGDSYRSFAGYTSGCACKGVQLDEAEVKTKPTAVIYYPETRCIVDGEQAIIVGV